MYRTFVVGIDGSETARTALHRALELARQVDDAVVHVVSAYRRPSATHLSPEAGEDVQDVGWLVDPLAAAIAVLEEAATDLRLLGVKSQTHAVPGDAADAVPSVADEVDAGLVVVGSRGLGRASRMLRGSVSTKVAHHCQRDLLIVH